MSHKFIRPLFLALAATALLAACAGATPTPAPTAEVISPAAAVTVAPVPQETNAAPAAAVPDSGFSRTADGLFSRGRADAPVVIYDYSDFL